MANIQPSMCPLGRKGICVQVTRHRRTAVVDNNCEGNTGRTKAQSYTCIAAELFPCAGCSMQEWKALSGFDA